MPDNEGRKAFVYPRMEDMKDGPEREGMALTIGSGLDRLHSEPEHLMLPLVPSLIARNAGGNFSEGAGAEVGFFRTKGNADGKVSAAASDQKTGKRTVWIDVNSGTAPMLSSLSRLFRTKPLE
jgi:hypothetical protein